MLVLDSNYWDFTSIERKKYYIQDYRSYFVLFFRALLIIIVPLIVSIILLPECGNYWTQFWKPCKYNQSSLDYSVYIYQVS